MAARLSLRPPPESRAKSDEVGTQSAVWPVRPSSRPGPTAAAFAIHDAKNMAGVLAANIEVLDRELEHVRLPEMAADALADIAESARRLTGLLREALAGLQGGMPQRTAPAVLLIAPVVAAVVEGMSPWARARGVRIVQAGPADACATIEPQLLERVIVNLLENAVRFSQPGDTVEVEYLTRAGRMTLAVGDRGPGVPEIARDEIFESYRHRPSIGAESHFGLGLAFCREVARANGGDAWVFNRAGGGACFVFETL
jgi:K+-sensing histidine kinase KdpD